MNTNRFNSMTAHGFETAMDPHKDALYTKLIEAAECGPFDGGCVVFAQALQRVMGGHIVVLTSPRGIAEHACVEFDQRLFDYDGPLPPAAFIERFSKNELATISGFRAIEASDLPEAYRGIKLEDDLARQLQDIFSIQQTVVSSGRVVDIANGVVTQKINRAGDTVQHDATKLSAAVTVGDVVDIKYVGALGVVSGLALGLQGVGR